MTPEEKIQAITGIRLGTKQKKQTSGEFMQSITGMYQLSPEAEERFSKSFIVNTKGTVRVDLLSLGVPALLFAALGTVLYFLTVGGGGLFVMLLIIAYALGVILFFWSKFSWRIDFDGSTGFVQYHTLFGGTKTYHVHELMAFETHITSITNAPLKYAGGMRRRSYRNAYFFQLRTITAKESLYISTEDGLIVVPVASAWHSSKLSRGIGGYVDSEKFLTYLDFYRRYMLEKDDYPEDNAAVRHHDLSPAVRRAIAEAQEKGDPAPVPETFPVLQADELDPVAVMQTTQEKPVHDIPDMSVPVTGLPETAPEIPKPRPVPEPEAKPASEPAPKYQPLPERPAMPERSSDFPDPTKTAFPDPARKPAAAVNEPQAAPAIPDVTEEPKPVPHENAFPDPAAKPPVDVDALFDQVLSDYGKSRHPEKPKKGLFRR